MSCQRSDDVSQAVAHFNYCRASIVVHRDRLEVPHVDDYHPILASEPIRDVAVLWKVRMREM
jgi:hypothetical protein